MALGIYKPGQGYWVRVLTATMIGVVTLAFAAWLWHQASVVASKLPRNQWSLVVTDTKGAIAPGQRVSLLEAKGAAAPAEIGTAEVAAFDAASQSLQLRSVSMSIPTGDPSVATSVSSSAQSGAFSAGVKHAVGMPAIDPELLQGGAAAFALIAGFILAYWLTALHKRFVEFLIATDMEMKKVNWSTRRDIVKSTGVVIFASILLAGSLFLVDFTFQLFFRAIGVLQ